MYSVDGGSTVTKTYFLKENALRVNLITCLTGSVKLEVLEIVYSAIPLRLNKQLFDHYKLWNVLLLWLVHWLGYALFWTYSPCVQQPYIFCHFTVVCLLWMMSITNTEYPNICELHLHRVVKWLKFSCGQNGCVSPLYYCFKIRFLDYKNNYFWIVVVRLRSNHNLKFFLDCWKGAQSEECKTEILSFRLVT